MQYTLRNIPSKLDEALRQRAQMEHKSLNQVAIEALMKEFALRDQSPMQRDLSDIAGSWMDDPETEAALDNQRGIEPELWR